MGRASVSDERKGEILARQITDTIIHARARMTYGFSSMDDVEVHLHPEARRLLLTTAGFRFFDFDPWADGVMWRSARLITRGDLKPGEWEVMVRVEKRAPRLVPDDRIPTGCDCGSCDG